MLARRIGSTWLVRVGIATAALAGIGLMAEPAREVAAGAAAGGDMTFMHAAALFAIVWVVASLRIRRANGRLMLGFDPVPVRRTPASQAQDHSKAGKAGKAGSD